MAQAYSPQTRKLVTLFALSGAFMTQLDATIANVAMPHMQAATSASREQIAWVLTSYIIMAAICTPLSGWLAERIGRKRVMVGSIIGFTAASALCGLATTLDQLIGFRLLQGMLGCALLPMSQAIMLDINPPERHGSAMAIWGLGAIMGPIIGPLLGGYLTENLSWRWIFYINLPFGIIATLGLLAFLKETRSANPSRLDLFGFGALVLAVGSFQLMLDRGQLQDWFESREIWIEATVSATAFYVLVVHTLTAKNSFVKPVLLRDANYLLGNVFGFFLGGLMYGVVALLAPMLAELMGYPIELVGLVTAPRGLGTMLSMLVIGRLHGKVDLRLLMLVALFFLGWSMLLLSNSSLAMDSWLVVFGGFIQGVGGGIMFVPIATIVFTTLDVRYRNEGAALNSLVRNLGAAVWISVLQTMTTRNAAIVHSRLVETVRPDNPVMTMRLPEMDLGVPGSAIALDNEISRQALMVAYTDSYWLIFIACLVVAPLVFLVRTTAQKAPAEAAYAID